MPKIMGTYALNNLIYSQQHESQNSQSVCYFSLYTELHFISLLVKQRKLKQTEIHPCLISASIQ